MPTYQYECAACGHNFEKFQSITAKAVKKCPECGKRKVERLISAGAGFIFKGSGFYITDYRSKEYKEAAKKDKDAAKKDKETASGGSSSSSESKSTDSAGGGSTESGGGKKKESKD